MTDDIRPTTRWRAARRKEAEEIAAGRKAREQCYLDQLYPDAFLDPTEAVLDGYAAAIAGLPATPEAYPAIMDQIGAATIALNEINERGDESWIETGEREALCAYIEEVVVRRGVDIDALARTHGLGRHELTDTWRDW